MDIRLVSTLTAEDEDRIAPAVLRAVTALLDQTSLSYTLRIETTSRRTFQHNHPAAVATVATPQLTINDAIFYPGAQASTES
jgi:hypothetical protein